MVDVMVHIDTLKTLVERKLTAHGLPPEQAALVSDVLVNTDARGVRSHGTLRIEHYCSRIQQGGINIGSKFPFTETAKAAGVMDADGGMGHYANFLAMNEAISRVQNTGVYAVSVKNSSHCGALSYYAEMALKAGLVSMVMVNTDTCVVPFGAREAYFGTNPVAFGLPGKKHRILIDMATSEVALGKIFSAREKGESIPPTWGVDEHGAPTTDPHKAVYATPMAAHKGTALALAIEGFTGLFTGAFGPYVVSMYGDSSLKKRRNVMSFMLVINPDIFGGKETYLAHTDRIFEEIRSLRPIPGVDRVLVPGEPEDLSYAAALKDGCPVYETVWKFLKS